MINGQTPPDDELAGVLGLLIGGGFDTTTALTAHALEWLYENPADRDRLSPSHL
jgi:cytochrome P450